MCFSFHFGCSYFHLDIASYEQGESGSLNKQNPLSVTKAICQQSLKYIPVAMPCIDIVAKTLSHTFSF